MTRLSELDADYPIRDELVAVMLHCSRETLAKHRREGRPPPHMKSGEASSKVLYPAGPLRDYLRQMQSPGRAKQDLAPNERPRSTDATADGGRRYVSSDEWLTFAPADEPHWFVLDSVYERPVDFIAALGLPPAPNDDHVRVAVLLTKEDYARRLLHALQAEKTEPDRQALLAAGAMACDDRQRGSKQERI